MAKKKSSYEEELSKAFKEMFEEDTKGMTDAEKAEYIRTFFM